MGIAADREEAARGLACVAAPIFVGQQAVAAVSVGFTASAGSGELFVNPLRETSAAIGRALAMTSSRAARLVIAGW
jgi:DNA-binding IclR family transcriptional regulator